MNDWITFETIPTVGNYLVKIDNIVLHHVVEVNKFINGFIIDNRDIVGTESQIVEDEVTILCNVTHYRHIEGDELELWFDIICPEKW